jgi:ADP-ribose pyrophosphatase
VEKWQLLNSTQVIDNYWTKVYKNHYKLPNGVDLPEWYIVERMDYVVVIAQAQDGKIVVEKQYRPATDCFFYELPAGNIEHNRSVEETALLELKEETGYIGTNPRIILKTSPIAGIVKAWGYFVLVDIVSKGSPQNEETEDIQSELLTVDQIGDLYQNSKYCDMGLYTGLFAYLQYMKKHE